MPRTIRHFINDILGAIDKIDGYIGDLDLATVEADQLRVDGVLFNLMIVGEAIKSIPAEI